MSRKRRVSVVGVGDILVDRQNPAEATSGIRSLLERSDLSFGNFEGVLTDCHGPTPGAAQGTIVPAINAEALRAFDVMSLANNHSMDAGYGGLVDTIAALSSRGVAVVGAGSSLSEALAPVVFDRGGVRVAFVAVASVLPVGTEARSSLAGVAPLRAHDHYAPRYPGYYCPGVAPRVVSLMDEGDWEATASAISEARESADVVVASIHWGDHTQPWVITEHERSCGRLLINAGADVVLGHHQHMLRAVEVVEGRPIFYGLGHVAFDQPRLAAELRSRGIEVEGLSDRELTARYGEFGIYPRPDSPDFPFHPLSRRTGVAVMEVDTTGVVRVGMAPCVIDSEGVARMVDRDGSEWSVAVHFLKDCVERVGLETQVIDRGWVHGGCHVVDFAAASEKAEACD